jgi:ketosteroid isomerase-like protein
LGFRELGFKPSLITSGAYVMNNVELVKQGYQLFAEGKIEEVLALWHPDFVWDECTGFPYITDDGIYVGPNAVVQNVFAQMPEHFEGFQVEITELFGCGDKVVMVGYYKGVWKATGKEFKANATHTWTVKDGKATHFFQAVDTAEIINP